MRAAASKDRNARFINFGWPIVAIHIDIPRSGDPGAENARKRGCDSRLIDTTATSIDDALGFFHPLRDSAMDDERERERETKDRLFFLFHLLLSCERHSFRRPSPTNFDARAREASSRELHFEISSLGARPTCEAGHVNAR